MLVPLTFGFVARVLTGPTLSPLGQLVLTRVVTPWLGGREHRLVPGPPKRFAQGIGATFTVGASVAWVLGAPVVAYVLIAGLVGAAFLEAAFGFCLGLCDLRPADAVGRGARLGVRGVQLPVAAVPRSGGRRGLNALVSGPMRLVIARCSVDYAGRLTAHLPEAMRLIMVKADGCVARSMPMAGPTSR